MTTHCPTPAARPTVAAARARRSTPTCAAPSPGSPTARRWSTSPTGRRCTYAELDAAVDELARGLLGPRRRARATASASGRRTAREWFLTQYATARIGAILVNINPAYRTHELEYVLRQAGVGTLISAVVVQDQRLPAMVDEVRPAARRRCATSSTSATRRWDALLADGARRHAPTTWPRVRPRCPSTTRSTSSTRPGTTGLPEGRDAQPPQHPQQRLLRRRGDGLHRGRTGSACRCPSTTASAWSMGNLGRDLARRLRRHPGARASTRRRRCGPSSTSGARRSTASRRCSSPSSALPDFADLRPVSSLRTGCMAGSPCPVEVMKRVITEMNMDEVTIAYGMTETSPVSTQTRKDDSLDRRTAHGRPRAPARRGDGRRPGDRPAGAVRRAGRAVHPRLLGDDRLLGRAGEDGRGAAPRLDAHRRPRRRWTTRATSTSSGGSRTWSSAAARTCTRARSRSSSTPTPTSSTPR